jgi:hypothetical protein
MPKNSGQDLQAVRTGPTRPQPKARQILHQVPPSAPRVRPMSPGAPKFAADLQPEEKGPTGSIDPRQMVF